MPWIESAAGDLINLEKVESIERHDGGIYVNFPDKEVWFSENKGNIWENLKLRLPLIPFRVLEIKDEK